MIVKNEEHIIERALRSAFRICDTWSIVDTGSTDKTKEIIQKVADELNIKGYLYDRPWLNFGHNRTEALSLAKQHMKWAFILDADDTLEGDFDKSILDTSFCGYNITMNQKNINVYQNLRFINCLFDWKYIGVTHEYPECLDTNAKKGELPSSIYINYTSQGHRNITKQKFVNDIELLQKELDDSNVINPRTLFYLAQSYRDAGIKNKAIQYYLERTNAGGWNQEIYMSYVNLVNLSDTYEDKLKYAWKAQNILPERKEAIYEVLLWGRKNNVFTHEMYSLALSCEGQLNPTYLFVNPFMYGWSFYDEFGLTAYNTKHYNLAYMLFNIALESCPAGEKERIQRNIEFSLQHIEPEIVEVAI